MTNTKLLLSFLISAASATLNAQAISCSIFCVKDIQLDTVGANTLSITLFMGGSSSDFINYPHVSSITDNSGNTLATGTPNFFGQIGNTTQVYTVSTTLNSLSPNFTCTLYFKYNSTTCTLAYPCVSTGMSEDDPFNATQIYPNPSPGKFTVRNDQSSEAEYKLKIYNTFGQHVYTGDYPIPKKGYEIDLSGYPRGIYFLEIKSGTKIHGKKIITY